MIGFIGRVRGLHVHCFTIDRGVRVSPNTNANDRYK